MTTTQVAYLPHALAGRDILGAAKTGSGKTLALLVAVLEKLFRERYTPESGLGSIIRSSTQESSFQTFEVLKSVAAHHNISACFLTLRIAVDLAKEDVKNLNDMNILVCTPILVLDEVNRLLDVYKRNLNAVIPQLPKKRQTLLFSKTHIKSDQDLARLSLKDPEYISVDPEYVAATPAALWQNAMIAAGLGKKFDILGLVS